VNDPHLGQITRFSHWEVQSAGWIGHYNPSTQMYDSINTTNIRHSLHAVEEVCRRHINNSAVVGVEPSKCN
jgi:hypothetical protein